MARNTQSIGFHAAIGAMLLLGAVASPAFAREGEREGHRGDRHDWNGGYYRAPPVVYGGYYGGNYGYVPPPIVYGPSMGIFMPGLNIIIR